MVFGHGGADSQTSYASDGRRSLLCVGSTVRRHTNRDQEIHSWDLHLFPPFWYGAKEWTAHTTQLIFVWVAVIAIVISCPTNGVEQGHMPWRALCFWWPFPHCYRWQARSCQTCLVLMVG